MGRARQITYLLEQYYDDFGNTGATPVDTAGGVRKAFSAGADPFPNGTYVWNPKTVSSMDIADSGQKINLVMRPGAHFKKITSLAIEIHGLTLVVSGVLLDKLMADSSLIER